MFKRQGRLWRQAGGLRQHCVYRRNSPERLLWDKGWDEEDEKTRKKEDVRGRNQGDKEST
jgi:hypothetical protein